LSNDLSGGNSTSYGNDTYTKSGTGSGFDDDSVNVGSGNYGVSVSSLLHAIGVLSICSLETLVVDLVVMITSR